MTRIFKTVLMAGAISLALTAIPAQAEQGDWIVRGGATMVSPKSGNLKIGDLGEFDLSDLGLGVVSIDNASLEVGDATSLGLTITYMMTDHWAIDVLAAVPFKHDIDLKATISDGEVSETGKVKIGDTKHLPPTISLQYHFMPEAFFSPYIGAGLNMTIFSSEKFNSTGEALAGLIFELTNPKLKLDTSTGVAAQIGADFNFGSGWLLNADIRYIDIGTKAKVVGDEGSVSLGTVNIDPIVYSIMVGYRF